MRAGRVFAVLAVAVLGVGLFTASAIAGKKKKTSVIFFANQPNINKNGKVTARGSLNTVSACKVNRSMRLQVIDPNGTVLATLDGGTSDQSGNWALSGQAPASINLSTNSVRVKANKRTAGKYVCKAGVSIAVPLTP